MTFEWIQCTFFLKKTVMDSEITINLTPYHKLQLVRDNCQIEDVNFEVKLQFQRPFNNSEALGWNWHKSWTIPDLSLTLNYGPACSTKVLGSIGNIYAEICAVKPVISKEYSLCVEDIGLEGASIQRIVNDSCIFSGLKFSGTSYNCEGSAFHLLVMVYTRCPDQSNPHIRILLSRISSPIFVDSRKSVRQNELLKFRKINSYLEPFETSHLHRAFTKKQSRRLGDCHEQKIQNDSIGLVNYFGAANIRYKVKHPLFLAIKFSQCFFIYFKRSAGHNPGSLIRLLQNCLNNTLTLMQNSSWKPMSSELANKEIIIVAQIVKSTNDRTIPEFLQIFQTTTIGCLPSTKLVPPNFQRLTITEQLTETYQGLQSELSSVYKSLMNAKAVELSEQTAAKADDRYEDCESLQSLKKVKTEEPGPLLRVADESSQSSEMSSDIDSMQRPDIPLKCEIILRPFKKKPLKLYQILELYDRSRQEILIECQKKQYCQSQLYSLNQILKRQASIKRQRIALLQLRRKNQMIPLFEPKQT